MTPSDHRTFIQYHLRWNISYGQMNQDEHWGKQKANRDARAALEYIYYQIQNLWNPLYAEIDKFLKNQKITEDHFKQPEHYTKLKEKIKICVTGVLFKVPLRKNNIPGNSLTS